MSAWSANRVRRILFAAILSASTAMAMVRGRVLLDDGMPPAAPIRVEMRCGNVPPASTTARADGGFAFDEPPAEDCTITAMLPGYASDTTPLRHLPLDPEIGGLTLRREGKWQGYALSSTTLAISDETLALFARGARALRIGGQAKMAEAEDWFAQAVATDEAHAEAWFQLARLRLSRGDIPAARRALEGAVKADPWFLSPYQPLLLLELAEERWAEARKLCDQWLRLAPNATDALFYRGIASVELDALTSAREALQSLQLAPEAAGFAPTHFLRGRIHEREGRMAEALAAYGEYVAAEPEGAMAQEARDRIARGRPR